MIDYASSVSRNESTSCMTAHCMDILDRLIPTTIVVLVKNRKWLLLHVSKTWESIAYSSGKYLKFDKEIDQDILKLYTLKNQKNIMILTTFVISTIITLPW